MLYAVLIFIISFLFTVISLPQILLVSYQKKLFDKPEARKQHRTPSSRLGGSCFVPVLFFSLFLVGSCIIKLESLAYLSAYTESLSHMGFFGAGLVLVYIMGLLDDLIGLGYKRKFLVQIFGALMLWMAGVGLNSLGGLFGITEISKWVSLPLTILFVVYITNAVNLIDGIDGLASGLGVVALLLFAYFSAHHFHLLNLLLFSSMLGIMLPFWYYNVYRRRQRNFKLFMGDAGSLSLGYVLSYGLLIFMHRYPDCDPWAEGTSLIALAAFIVPCFDIVRVMLVRYRAGKGLFLPDRNHIHHARPQPHPSQTAAGRSEAPLCDVCPGGLLPAVCGTECLVGSFVRAHLGLSGRCGGVAAFPCDLEPAIAPDVSKYQSVIT